MNPEQWKAVDRYLTDLLVPSDAALEAVVQSSVDAGLPAIAVSPVQGKLLHVLARAQGARSILEIGTLAGYSTIWLARALPAGGRLVTLEIDAKCAEIARANIALAGLADVVELRLGSALETLPRLADEGRGPFDLVFIDADKANTPQYFEWAMRLTRPGSLIIVDNIARQGAVTDPTSSDQDVQGMRRFFEMLAADRRVTASAIQTVGSKGYDGLAIALVTGE